MGSSYSRTLSLLLETGTLYYGAGGCSLNYGLMISAVLAFEKRKFLDLDSLFLFVILGLISILYDVKDSLNI